MISIEMKIKKALCLIALFLLIISSTTIYSYYFTTISNIFLVIGGLITLLLMILQYNKKIISIHAITSSIVYLFLISIPSILNGISTSLFYYYFKFIILFFLLSLFYYNKISLYNTLYNIMKIFLVWGFLNYFITFFNISFLPKTSTFLTEWGGSYDLYLFIFFKNTQNSFEIFGMDIQRLHSPFSEPGVTQFFFNLGLIFSLFFNNRKTNRKIWICLFSLGIILSTSLIGIFIWLCIFLIYLISKKKFIKLILSFGIFSIILTIFIIQKIDTISYIDRLSDFDFIFSTASNHFPFGIGIGNRGNIGNRIDVMTGELTNVDFFSGLFTPLVYFGIFSIAFYVMLFIACNMFSNNRFMNLSFSILILFTLLTEPLSLAIISILFIVNGIIRESCFKKRGFYECTINYSYF